MPRFWSAIQEKASIRSFWLMCLSIFGKKMEPQLVNFGVWDWGWRSHVKLWNCTAAEFGLRVGVKDREPASPLNFPSCIPRIRLKKLPIQLKLDRTSFTWLLCACWLWMLGSEE